MSVGRVFSWHVAIGPSVRLVRLFSQLDYRNVNLLKLMNLLVQEVSKRCVRVAGIGECHYRSVDEGLAAPNGNSRYLQDGAPV